MINPLPGSNSRNMIMEVGDEDGAERCSFVRATIFSPTTPLKISNTSYFKLI